MHPALMKKLSGGMAAPMVEVEIEVEPPKDPYMELMEGVHKKDMPKCLRALADIFAKESTE